MTYTAVFEKGSHAVDFFNRLMKNEDGAENVQIRELTVTFEAFEEDGGTLSDYRELVGYFGNTDIHKATLNGLSTPRQY